MCQGSILVRPTALGAKLRAKMRRIPTRQLVAVVVLLAALARIRFPPTPSISLDLSRDESAAIVPVCEAHDEACQAARVEQAFPLSLIWPPSLTTAPNLAVLTLTVWTVVALAVLSRESEAERAYQRKRAHQILAQVAQTKYEHAENTAKWDRYSERAATMRRMAKERLDSLLAENPRVGVTEESVYQQVIAETGFINEEKPGAALHPRRVLEVLVDEVDDCPVIEIPGLSRCLGEERFQQLRGYFTIVQPVLVERMLAKLEETHEKTQSGLQDEKDPRYATFASGVKLMEFIELGKKVKKQFYPNRLFGLRQPKVEDPTAARLLKKLSEAKALMREIRRRQPSRLLQILGLFELRTFGYLACACLTRIFGGSIGPARGFFFNQVVVDASREDWQEPVGYSLLCIGVIFFFDWYVNDWLSMVATTKATSLLKHALRTKLFEAVMRQDSEYFEANDSSAIQDRVKHDCDQVADSAIYIPMDIIGILSSVVWHVLLMYTYCPGMLPRTLAIGGVVAPVFIVLNKLTDALRKKDDRTLRAMRSQTDEMLQKVKAVREFSRERQEAVELDRGERVQMKSMILLHIMGHVQHMLIFTILFGGEISNYWYGASLVSEKKLEPVKLIQVGGLVYHITFMIKHLLGQVPRLMEIMLPAGRIFELLESKSLIEPMPGDEKAPFEKKNGGLELELRDVTFAYPLMPEVTVLRHLSLKIPAGKTVAICGERAAGKSTMYYVMQRMYDVEYGKGQVIVNDHPISHWDVRSYRRSIAILAQKGLLFRGTIKENILYGLSEAEQRLRGFDNPAGDAEIQRLLEISGAWDVVKEFPLRTEQRIGCGGVSLSGGTEQCLFIARGLVKEPALLMMDEATSAMDTNTQKRAAEGIAAEQRRLGFSVVQVAHRIETLTRSDVLYFVEHGTVVEVGGEATMNGTACEEMAAREAVYRKVVNPESGELEDRLESGFYRQLHEAYYDLSFQSMKLPALLRKVRALEEQLERAKAEKEAKLSTMLAKLPPAPQPLERSTTDQGEISKAPRPSRAPVCIVGICEAALPTDEELPSPPPAPSGLVRWRTEPTRS